MRSTHAIAMALGAVGVLSTTPAGVAAQRAGGRGPMTPGLTLTSTGWEDGGAIPDRFAGAEAVSPALAWTNVPEGTAELVLIMNDPEPVRPPLSVSGDILHWLIAKIPADLTSLPEGAGAADSPSLPAGARQIQPYRGPGAPVPPMHHYTLTLYALNAPLDLATDADRAAVVAAMEGKVLARGIFTGRFVRAQ